MLKRRGNDSLGCCRGKKVISFTAWEKKTRALAIGKRKKVARVGRNFARPLSREAPQSSL